ncbi:MAG: tetratricopeptide repeat protein, partial [Rhodoferax sp.]|nr:tetratricopeptide repeat protein [Rhodoferax sp.]
MVHSAWQFIVATDIVDSTRVASEVADASALWAEHDRAARDLVRAHGGREIGRTDGIVVLFEGAAQARTFAAEYHDALSRLSTPLLARVAIAGGTVVVRENRAEDIALGAVPFEVDGPVLPIAMRVQAMCGGGQTLASVNLKADGSGQRLHSHGLWRLKGEPAPIEVFEFLGTGTHPRRPRDVEKAFQVERIDGEWQPVSVGHSRLPRMEGRFVGREDQIRDIGDRIEAGEHLITLLGTGGVGKTRLALQFARCGPVYFEGGAWFCDLSAAADEDGVLQAVSQGLGVPLAGADPAGLLGHAMAGRGRCVVILDNAESAVQAVSALAAQWRVAAPQATLLLTSRTLIGVAGESAVEVEPLTPTEAGLLFEHRAQGAGVTLGDADKGSVPLLVDALDRLPLALELSAARTPSMSPAQQVAHMRERRRWMTAAGNVQRRHGTLAQVFEASWLLLSSNERSVLAQCTVFEGGFSLEDAIAVVHTDGDWVGAVLGSLVSKSLLRRQGNGRLGLLQTVRDEAEAREEVTPDRTRATARHGRHFASLDERVLWTAGFCDLDNLIAAFEHALARSDHDTATKALSLCAEVLLVRGPVRRLRSLALQALAVGDLPASMEAEVSRVLGNALYALGQREESVQRYRTGLQLCASSDARGLRIRLACALSTPLARSGQTSEAMALLQRRDEDDALLDDPVRGCALANAKGAVTMAAQSMPEAIGHFERALLLATAAGHRRWEGGVRGNLGGALYLSGRRAEARHHYEAALSIASGIGDRAWAANAQCNLGLMLLEDGRRDEA